MKDSKEYNVIISLSLLLYLFLALPQVLHSSDSELQHKKNRNEALVFVNSLSFPPYSMLDDEGNVEGIFIDYWKAAAQKVNLNIRFELMHWYKTLEAMKAKKADVHAGLFMTEERAQFMDFSDSYLSIRTALFIKHDLELNSKKDFQNITIGVVKSDAGEKYLRKKYPRVKIQEYYYSSLIIEDALKGKIHGFVSDGIEAHYYLYQKNALGKMIVYEILYTDQIRAGVTKGDYKTLALINKAINLMREEEVKKITNKWGHNEPYSLINDKRFIIIATISITSVGIIILIILGLNRMLKIKVAQQTKQISKELNEKKKIELSLLKTKNYLQDLIDCLPVFIITLNSQCSIILYNKAAEAFCRQDNIGHQDRNLFMLVPDLIDFKDDILQAFNNGTSISYTYFKLPSFHNKYFNINILPISYKDNNTVLFMLTDVTSMVEKDKQLRKSQKFEMIGTLASGLAHDFNNILMGVIGPVSELSYIQDSNGIISQEDININLSIMEHAADKAKDIVNKLLTLSTNLERGNEPVNLNSILKNVELICRASLHKGIHIETYYPDKELHMKADPTHIEQIVLNICINAAHAMTIMRPKENDAGGDLTIILKEVTADNIFALTQKAGKGEKFCSISIQDTGIGMNDEALKNIFDPFFTTKSKDSGSGLGMSVVYNIIKLYNGEINISTKTKVGTTITIFLPICDSIAETNNRDDDQIINCEGQILLIDDDEMVLNVTERMLSKCGYDVLTAKNGIEAIALYNNNYEDIDIVVLDIFLPNMSGKEIFKELYKINENIDVIIVSGNRSDKRIDDLINMGARSFLQKPYSLQDIYKVLSELI